MKHLRLAGPGERLSVLCIGAPRTISKSAPARRSWAGSILALGQLLKAWMTSPKVRELI